MNSTLLNSEVIKVYHPGEWDPPAEWTVFPWEMVEETEEGTGYLAIAFDPAKVEVREVPEHDFGCIASQLCPDVSTGCLCEVGGPQNHSIIKERGWEFLGRTGLGGVDVWYRAKV